MRAPSRYGSPGQTDCCARPRPRLSCRQRTSRALRAACVRGRQIGEVAHRAMARRGRDQRTRCRVARCGLTAPAGARACRSEGMRRASYGAYAKIGCVSGSGVSCSPEQVLRDADLLPHLVAVIHHDLHRAVDFIGTFGAGCIANAHHRRAERFELSHELVERSELFLA